MQLRFAGRLFVKSPLFTGIVVLTMAIAIGLNTTVFAAVESMLLRPLPGASAPDRLVQLYRTGAGMPWGSNSVPHYQDVRERTGDAFEGVAAWTYAYYSMSAGDRPRRLMGQIVSANYFTTLGVRPALGRFFLPAEDSTRGAHPVVVLGYSTWRGMFGGDPGVIGRGILFNGQSMQVVGVAPPEFRGAMPILDPAAYVPLMQMGQMQPERAGSFESRWNNFLNVVARLRDGVSVEQASARLSLVNDQLAAVYPEPYLERGTSIIRQADAGIHPMMRTAQVGLSAVILAVVGLLLLIACVNISNLFLARAHDRGKEMAVRLALGASRGQLLRQLLAESLLFALPPAPGSWRWLASARQRITLPLDIGFRPDLSLNPKVLVFTLGVTPRRAPLRTRAGVPGHTALVDPGTQRGSAGRRRPIPGAPRADRGADGTLDHPADLRGALPLQPPYRDDARCRLHAGRCGHSEPGPRTPGLRSPEDRAVLPLPLRAAPRHAQRGGGRDERGPSAQHRRLGHARRNPGLHAGARGRNEHPLHERQPWVFRCHRHPPRGRPRFHRA
jgi:hypothetical protein